MVTNEGLNHALDVILHGSSQTATWYIGLINNSPTPTLAAGDTLASHAGWSESTDYSSNSGNRHTWTEGAASSQATTNSATVDFTMDAAVTIYGLILASVNTGTSGILFLTAAWAGGPQAVNNLDVLQVTLTVTAAAA